jgi:predicted transcriptional regulator
MSKSKVSIATDTTEGFFNRVRGHAAKLDRGETIPAKISITFEDPLEMLNVLTAERVRLLRWARAGSQPISELATGLKRDVRAVSRDVVRLEKAGLLQLSNQSRTWQVQSRRTGRPGIQLDGQPLVARSAIKHPCARYFRFRS